MPRNAPSMLATWSATILRALAARGLDTAALATRAGIDPTNLGPDARVPRATLNRLWELTVRLIDAGDRYRFEIDVSAHAGVPLQAVARHRRAPLRRGGPAVGHRDCLRARIRRDEHVLTRVQALDGAVTT